MEQERRRTPDERGRLRAVLNEWDPVGVQGAQDDGGPYDEYDCLIGPLSSLLLAGADKRAVKAYLRSELHDHFGLEGQRVPNRVVDQILLAWAPSN